MIYIWKLLLQPELKLAEPIFINSKCTDDIKFKTARNFPKKYFSKFYGFSLILKVCIREKGQRGLGKKHKALNYYPKSKIYPITGYFGHFRNLVLPVMLGWPLHE